MNRRQLCLGMAVGAGQALLPSSVFARAPSPDGGRSADLADLSLAQSSQALRTHQVSSEQLVRACLARVDSENPTVNAVITAMRTEALAEAKALDREAQSGRYRSALHGIPIALKDNIDVSGIRTTNASALHKDRIAADDAEVVRRLKRAGAIIIAKTNLSEFALASATSASSFFGPVLNPWDKDYVSGGSSGGSAAAVATGMCFGALGTDSGGSVRIPAAWCGLTGLKPTIGLIPTSGIGPGVPLIDTCGPIARTAEDVALLLDHLAGYDPLDPMSAERPREVYSAALASPPPRLRVGVPRHPYFDDADAEVAGAVERAIAILAGIAGSVQDVRFDPGEDPDLTAAMMDIYNDHRENLATRGDAYQHAIGRALRSMGDSLDGPAALPAADQLSQYIRSRKALLRKQRTVDAAFKGFDVLVMPTIRILPQRLEEALHSEYHDGPPNHAAIVANTMRFNVLGLPALTLPCGFSKNGLPIGMMIVGPRFSEATLLALGAAYQRSTTWHLRRPPRAGRASRPGERAASAV